MKLVTEVTVQEANDILFALENAPMPLIKTSPLINKLKTDWTQQLNKEQVKDVRAEEPKNEDATKEA